MRSNCTTFCALDRNGASRIKRQMARLRMIVFMFIIIVGRTSLVKNYVAHSIPVIRNAELHSAVSPIFNRQGVKKRERRLFHATQNSILRYGGLQIRATVFYWACGRFDSVAAPLQVPPSQKSIARVIAARNNIRTPIARKMAVTVR